MGLLSRPCARMETDVTTVVLGVYATLCLALVLAMLCFGPEILEWIEDASGEPG
jgi:hypothetical protein